MLVHTNGILKNNLPYVQWHMQAFRQSNAHAKPGGGKITMRRKDTLAKAWRNVETEKDQQLQQTDKEVELLKLLLLRYWILHQDIKLIKTQKNPTWCTSSPM